MQNTTEIDEIVIKGVTYVPKGTENQKLDPDSAVIIRTRSAGVFFGYITSGRESLEKGLVDLRQARRIWFWAGAASLSQLATDGTSKPNECKFPVALAKITLTEVLEVIYCTEAAVKSINSVRVWKQ